ncbi:MAG: acetylornithine/succinylornithine family transaminase [Candidatus Bathyarchaeota archaeon]|nr:acetylornithine/succinylornithine family transaminase [Candidatus Bathyarchaeota archaeon]
MNENKIIDIENNLMANVFAKKKIVLEKGKGVLVWDIHGKEYLDFSSSYGVAALGHSHPKIVKAINEQTKKLISCHSGFYNPKRAELLQKIVNLTPNELNKIFLSNSGAESIECAIKLARKYTGKTEIISFMGGYHGKTMGALSATWDKKYRKPFEPLIPDFKHIPPNNLAKLQDAITDKTAAVLLEPVRGESGVRVSSQGFLQGVKKICDNKHVLLILDEVQTGFGRTGKFFSAEHWKIIPDILCLAKPFAGGLPIGITIAKENIMSSLKIGEHTSTFSGSPVVCAAACAAIDVLLEEKLVENAANQGAYFKSRLEGLKNKYKIIKEVRGLGLMLAIELRKEVYEIIQKAMNRGLLILNAGRNVIRFLPPLIVSKNQIDRAITIIDSILGEE